MDWPAIFLDKDGTLLEDVPYNVDPRQMRFAPGAVAGLPRLHRAGYRLIVISNQPGVALGMFSEEALAGVAWQLAQMFAEVGAPLAGFYYCPHHPQGSVAAYARVCDCRKPQPGLVRRAAAACQVDPARSWFVGDILDDVEAGHRAGCRSLLVDNGNETHWRLSDARLPDAVAGDLAEAAQAILALGRPRRRRLSQGAPA